MALAKLIWNPYFEESIMCLIGLNSLLLMISEPILTDPYSIKTIYVLNTTISFIYVAECLIKIITYGFVIGKNTYLSENFNRFDFMIVMLSLIDLSLEYYKVGISLGTIKVFRAMRALRPLKLISKDKGMKLVVNSLLLSIPNLVNVLMIFLLFLSVFAILSVQILSGKLSSCSPASISLSHEDMCVQFNQTWNGTCSNHQKHIMKKSECLIAGGNWTTPSNNYNNIGHALTTFFEISTLETWPEVMFAAVDSSNNVDEISVKGNKPWMQLFFIGYIFFTTFFALGLFLNVMVDKFYEESEKLKIDSCLSAEK